MIGRTLSHFETTAKPDAVPFAQPFAQVDSALTRA